MGHPPYCENWVFMMNNSSTKRRIAWHAVIFDTLNCLIYIARGLLDAHKIGEEAYQAFERDRLEGEITTRFTRKWQRRGWRRFQTYKELAFCKHLKVGGPASWQNYLCLVTQSRYLQMGDVISTLFKVIQGHRFWYQSKAHIRLLISDYLNYLLSYTVSKLWLIIGQIFDSERGVPHFNALAGVILCQ